MQKKGSPKKIASKKAVLKTKRPHSKEKKEGKPKEYDYKPLSDLAKKEIARVNCWAVVLDCSAPYYMDKTRKYLMTVKLIDESLCGKGKGKAQEFLTCTMFAKTAAELPPINKIGTIIRVHRGQTKKFKDVIQLNVDVNIKAAWLIFDPYDGQTPLAQKGKRYTYTAEDKQSLKTMRKFVKDYFEKKDLESLSLKEAEKKKPKDFDTLLYVLEVKAKGKEEKVKLCDGSKVVDLHLPSNRKGLVAPQEVVRIRSANFDKGFKELTLNEYSNILRVPKEFVAAKDLLKELEGTKMTDIKKEVSLHMGMKEEPTKLLKKTGKPITLKELFAGKAAQKLYKVHVGVVEVGPKDPKDWICVVEKKTKKQFKLDEILTKKGKGKLPEGMSYYMKMQFFVKDKSATKDNSMYTLFLCSVEGKGKEFIKLDLGNEAPSEEVYKELKRVYKFLTRPGLELDLLVEPAEGTGKQPVIFIVDTELNI